MIKNVCAKCEEIERLDEDELCWYCRREELAAQKRLIFAVAVYHVELAYGGAAEGGWWYDRGERVRPERRFKSETAANAYAARLNGHLHGLVNKHRRPKSSVLSNGVYEAHVFEARAPESFPERRPHYE